MADLYVEQNNFAGGVQPALALDRLPDNAFVAGVNSAFQEIGPNQASIGTRPGLTVINNTAIADFPSLHFLRLYSYDTGNGYTNYLVTCAQNGKLFYKKPDNTLTTELLTPTNFPAYSGSQCFSSGDNLVDGTVFNNRLFLLNHAGERRSLLNQTYVPWGLTPIASSSVTNVSGGSSLPADTYDVAITSYHSSTGGESSVNTAAVVTTTTNQRIRVQITPTAAESAQYTHWRIYLRRRSTQSRLYLVTTVKNSGGSSITTSGDIPIGTLDAYVDLTGDTISLLTTTAPSTVENAPPPANLKYIAAYGRRIVVADDRKIYWSKQDKADNFPPTNFEPIETGEGDRITGIYPFSEELLLVFLTTAVWGIFGNDPQTWTVKPIDHTVGCVSHLSIVEFNGGVGWWSDAYGPVLYNGSTMTRLGERDLGRDLYLNGVNYSRANHIWGGHDPQFARIVWAVPESGQLRNTMLIPYNYRVDRFEATKWTPMPAAALALGYNDDSTPKLFLGNDRGMLFYFDANASTDGAGTFVDVTLPGGGIQSESRLSGQFTPINTISISSITDATDPDLVFKTSGSGLIGRYVLIVGPDNVPVAKREIFNSSSPTTSNTKTVLYLGSPVTVQEGKTYRYYIAGPDFRVSTRAYDMGQTFLRKRFDRIYFSVKSRRGANVLFITTNINFLDTTLQSLPANLILGGDTWDGTGIWDVSNWGADLTRKKRLSFFRPAQSVQINLFHYLPEQDITFASIGLLARQQSDRYYG